MQGIGSEERKVKGKEREAMKRKKGEEERI